MKTVISFSGLLGFPLFFSSHVTANSVMTMSFFSSEPVSLILLGIGLISLADLGRKILFKKKS
jgi:hypothetical protein